MSYLLGGGGIDLVVDIVRVNLNEGNQMKALWIVVNGKGLVGCNEGFAE